MKGFIVRMETEAHKDLKTFCASKGVSMQEFINRAVEEYRKKWVM